MTDAAIRASDNREKWRDLIAMGRPIMRTVVMMLWVILQRGLQFCFELGIDPLIRI